MSESKPTGWEGADRWFASPGPSGDPEGAAPEPDAAPRCEVCGSALEADQTYCLECGSPTPLAPRLRRGSRGVAILAGAMVVLGLGAGALAYAVVEDDDPGAPSGSDATGLTVPPAETTPVVPLPPETAPTVGSLPVDPSVTAPATTGATTPDTTGSATGFDTVTGASGAPTTDTTTTSTASTAPSTATTASTATTTTTTDPATGDSDWPAGRTAWTAVLSSVRDESDARAAKSRVAAAGDEAGVLFSSDFSDLRAGYWVVFSGSFASRTTAIAHATKLRPSYPTAYARRIVG